MARKKSGAQLNFSPTDPISSQGPVDPTNIGYDSSQTTPENPLTDNDIILQIQDHIKQWLDINRDSLEEIKDNKRFVYVSQWTDAETGRLDQAGKPVMQSNKLYDVINKIGAEYRLIGGELKVKSLTHTATDEDIKLHEDFLRNIYFNSESQEAYYKTYDDVVMGFGVYGIGIMYESQDSGNMMPYIYYYGEPEKAYFDINAKRSHKQDGQFCGKHTTYTRKAFEAMWPDIKYPSSFTSSLNDTDFSWGNQDMITVVDEYRKEWKEYNIHFLSNGQWVNDDEWEKIKEVNESYESLNLEGGMQLMPGANLPQHESFSIKKTIKKYRPQIILYKAIATQIIEKSVFPGSELPLIFVSGPSTYINGVERYSSIVRYAKDSQRLHNYVMVEIAYSLQSSRKERYMATEANISDYHDIWENPLDVQGALIYRPDPISGEKPIPLTQSELPQTYMALYNQMGQSIQDNMGYFDANRGKDTVEKSGIALARQQMAGSMSAGKAKSNMDSAIAQGGQVIMSMRKDIFDTQRTITVLDTNKRERRVTVNQKIPNNYEMMNDFTKGDFKVVYVAGPTQQMQKEIQLNFMAKLAENSGSPKDFGDLLAEMGDALPSFVERSRMLVDPQILAKEEGKQPPPQQLNPQLMLAQKQMELEEKKIQVEVGKLQLEEKKIMSQMAKLQVDEKIAGIKANAEIRKAALDHNKGMVDATAKIVSSHNDVRKEIGKMAHARHKQAV